MDGISRRLAGGFLSLAILVVSAPRAWSDTVDVSPARDNTIFSESGSESNGSGQRIFAGRTNFTGGGSLRRALLAFDVAGSIPAGATITSAALTLNLSRSRATTVDLSLHRLLADWGESTSDASGQEGKGAPAASGDATWTQRFFPLTPWTTDGGDFVAGSSATQSVGSTLGNYTWGSTAQMVADVQEWLDNPGSDFGWILIGEESSMGTAKRFDSVQHTTIANRPVLAVDFTPGAAGAGRVPDGNQLPGPPLEVNKIGTEIELSWSESCNAGDDDYEIYEGDLSIPGSHVDRFCSTAGATSIQFTPAPGSRYYIVVPTNGSAEGSYGSDGDGEERDVGPSTCPLPKQADTCG